MSAARARRRRVRVGRRAGVDGRQAAGEQRRQPRRRRGLRHLPAGGALLPRRRPADTGDDARRSTSPTSTGNADFALLMEDMSAYHLGDQIRGCTADEAELCVEELAEARTPASGTTSTGPELEFMPYLHGVAPRRCPASRVRRIGWDVDARRVRDVVPESIRAVKDRFLAAVPRMQEWMTTPPVDCLPRRLPHGQPVLRQRSRPGPHRRRRLAGVPAGQGLP